MFAWNTGLFFSLLSMEIDDFLFPLIDCGDFFLCCSEQQNILYPTVQYQAQFIEGVGADWLLMFHSSKCIAAYPPVIYKLIFRDFPFFHGGPQWFI